MGNILAKEIRLSASCLSFIFILFGIMFILPGYPILCGAFFIAMGIFQSFRNVGETNDILFSALLPIAKRDVVKGKFIFTCFIELCGLALMGIVMILRMTVLAASGVYRSNALMNANPFALGMAFAIFGLFNLIFVAGFFKTAYKYGKPFVIFIIVNFIAIFIAEALHYVPGLSWVNAFGTDHLGGQLVLLLLGVAAFAVLTGLSYNLACRRFERIDL